MIAVETILVFPVSHLDNLMKNWSIPESITDKQFYSPHELKDILGLSLPTIYRLIDSRKLPAYKIGHQLRFSSEDIVEYLKKNRIDQIA